MKKLGKSLLLPVSCMPICALLMGIGYCLCPAAIQGGEVSGIVAGAKGVVRPGKNSLQVVIGTSVQFVADELKILYKK